MVKPNVGSGSAGVEVVWSKPELALARARLAAQGAAAVVEEFVAGPSLSVDMVSFGGETADAGADLARVRQGLGLQAGGRAGPGAAVDPASQGGGSDVVSASTLEALDEAARRLAGAVGRVEPATVPGLQHEPRGLCGVMDVEAMVPADGVPRVIEIDARLPSQTPACAFHASDVNLIEVLATAFAAGAVPPALAGGRPAATAARRGAVYEHVLVADGRVQVLGEHVVGAAGPLRRYDGLWGADVVLTDGPVERPVARGVVVLDEVRAARAGAPSERWVAVIMTRGETASEARSRAAGAVDRLAGEHGLDVVLE